MTPAARVQAAIEVLDEVIASARDDGPPADNIVTRYFKHRRYAGSKDRRALRELVFRAIRRTAATPGRGRGGCGGSARSAGRRNGRRAGVRLSLDSPRMSRNLPSCLGSRAAPSRSL